MAITVAKINDTTFQVTVAESSTTTHTVTVTPDYYRKLTNGRAPVESLIEKAFEFLLEEESNTSILKSFDLPVIQRYFSHFEKTVQEKFT